MRAFELVKANAGAAGVDKQSLSDFERNLADNLYKLWNRLSSGSYFPPPVKAVAIPKKAGGERLLGIPTVSDRIAQMVVKLEFEPQVEPHFLSDSYGYRPNKSALDAVGVTRERCWRYDWVLEFDIKGLFDKRGGRLAPPATTCSNYPQTSPLVRSVSVTGLVTSACSINRRNKSPRFLEVRRLNRKVNSSKYACK